MIINEVRGIIQVTNPDHDITVKRIYPYYDIKLVIFGINDEINLIV